MIKDIYWLYDENNVFGVSAKKLLIVGPSGSGKSTLAEYLCTKYYETFEININCTTRERRNDDQRYFRYYTKEQFFVAMENLEFLMARFGESVLYGYRKEDYEKIVKKGKIPIFMFRFSGLKYLHENLKNYYVIFLSADTEKSLKYSKDNTGMDILSESKYINREMENAVKDLGLDTQRFFVIRNDYTKGFFEQLDNSGIIGILKKKYVTEKRGGDRDAG